MNIVHYYVSQLLLIVSVVCHQPICLAGGEKAESLEFPFMAVIYHKTMSCSGAILSEEWIITAAHCFSFSHIYALRASDVKVIAGSVNYAQKTNHTQIRHGTEIYIHPNYRVSKINHINPCSQQTTLVYFSVI